MSAVAATPDADVGSLQEIVVTAQKRTENLQDVPISIVAYSTEKLEQLNIASLDGYVKYSPSVSYVRGQGQGSNGQPGNSHIYMRGVVSGGDGSLSGPQPGVGTYLDEQAVTTNYGSLDVHIYDIQRIEVLEGPQGTLYGASSESGTIRIITNKPDPTKFAAGYDLDANRIDHGGNGWGVEGFVNIPLTSFAAIRLVGWDEHAGGYISNVAGTNAGACIQNGVRTFPTWDGQPYSFPVTPCPSPGTIGAGAISNSAYRATNYNTVDTKGGRAALKLDLGDSWTVTPSVMGQSLETQGFFGYDPAVGDLQVVHFGPEKSTDSFVQAALTIQGKIGNFDLTYAGAYLKRDIHSIADYSDYSEFYDRIYGSGSVWFDNAHHPIDPQELAIGRGHLEKWSHELRLTTPQDQPVKGIVGLFVERQLVNLWSQYSMPGYGFTNPYGVLNSPNPNPDGFADALSIPGLANTVWLTAEQRVDRDQAAFAQATWDISPKWSVNAGMRYFKYDNSLQGFYGYSAAFQAVLGFGPGQAFCFAPASVANTPCTDLNKTVSDSGTAPRLNVTYKLAPDKLLYATYSKGFRPGGVNRTAVANIGPYQADYLKNYEVGWKTQWFDNRLRWNGAAFWEDWTNFQFVYLGPNSLPIVANGGNARIKGIETDIEWAATAALTISTNFTFLDPRLRTNYCVRSGMTDCPTLVTRNRFGGPSVVGPLAPAGTNLPVTPKFKGNVVARYSVEPIGGWKPFAQAAWVYQTQTAPSLLLNEVENTGMMPAYGLVDVAVGMQKENMFVQLSVTNATDRRAELSRFTVTSPRVDNQAYIIPAQPRTIGIKFGQKF